MNQIKAIRKARGLSAEQIASAICVSPATVYRWESEECDLGSSPLCRLADLLGVTTDELLGRETPNDRTTKEEKTMAGSNFKSDVTRKGLEVYTSKGNVVQECYRHRLKKYQLEKILALCDATGKRPREVVKELIDFALSRVVIREITHVDLAFEEPTEEGEEA